MNTTRLVVPDRYEGLARRAKEDLGSIVVAVEEGLARIEDIFGRMGVAGRGSFLILRGPSGAGKSTFLHTLRFFKQDVITIPVAGGVSIREALQAHKATQAKVEVFVLEEREAAISFTDRELEDWLHAINGFIRSVKGEKALVVWPANTDELCNRIVELARRIGAETLLGSDDRSVFEFSGPSRVEYERIAERTLAVLNQGATFSDLGLTKARVSSIAESSPTIGGFLTKLHDDIAENERYIQTLVNEEQCRLWIIVATGNDPQAEVAGLTRGRFAAIDTDRLLSSTGANIVTELNEFPEKIGLLGTVLDARILHLPVLTAAAIIRSFADEPLKTKMKSVGLSLKPDDKETALERLASTELSSVFRAGAQGTLARGPKLGSSSFEAFAKLANIASTNDVALNRAVGRAFVSAGLIQSFAVEQDFGKVAKRRTDILAQTTSGPIRIEMMWRKTAGRADISNYTLIKLANYGRAIGYLD